MHNYALFLIMLLGISEYLTFEKFPFMRYVVFCINSYLLDPLRAQQFLQFNFLTPDVTTRALSV